MNVSLALDKPSYTLGDNILATVKVTNEGKSPVQAAKPKLDLASVGFILQRDKSAPTPESYIVRLDQKVEQATLKPGESVSGQIELLACEPGSFTLIAMHGHSGPWSPGYAKSNATKSNLINFKVAPAQKGQRMRAKLTTEAGPISLIFFPERAHNHVLGFLQLAKKGYYNGIKFHRVVPGFVIQGGDPTGTGGGGPGYAIPGEFNEIKHVPGILSMARKPDPHTGGSQFFVCTAITSSLDNKYTVFGQVESGMEAVQEIGADEDNAGKFTMKKVEVSVS
jgi:cyclophilin family peptidyl-prolyl cis-trans isomerase